VLGLERREAVILHQFGKPNLTDLNVLGLTSDDADAAAPRRSSGQMTFVTRDCARALLLVSTPHCVRSEWHASRYRLHPLHYVAPLEHGLGPQLAGDSGFVGRERELQVLRQQLADVLAGAGRVVLLAGEPGIGKTGTAEQFSALAREQGMRVIWGRCYEGEGAPAFWPWLQILRAYMRGLDNDVLLAEMGARAEYIVQLLPELRQRFPDLEAVPRSSDPLEARFFLFDNVSEFLREVSSPQPLLLVIDDIHAADRASLLLLEYLAADISSSSLMLLATYRDVEVDQKHALARTLAELARLASARSLLLQGLAERDVERLLAGSLDCEPPVGMAAALVHRTEGNPFFLKEIVHLLRAEERRDNRTWTLDTEIHIPRTVRLVIGRRLQHVSPETHAILRTAAVIGKESDFDILEQSSQFPSRHLLKALQEAVDLQVLVEVPQVVGRYAFAHSLIQQVLYEELQALPRAQLHELVGLALETHRRRMPEFQLSQLADHFVRAAATGREVGRAIDYSRRAGDYPLGLHLVRQVERRNQ
jgi:predicted ATPase